MRPSWRPCTSRSSAHAASWEVRMIDADTHVLEDWSTWDHLDPEERIYRPRLAEFRAEPGQPEVDEYYRHRMWITSDSWVRKSPPNGGRGTYGREFPEGAGNLDDV